MKIKVKKRTAFVRGEKGSVLTYTVFGFVNTNQIKEEFAKRNERLLATEDAEVLTVIVPSDMTLKSVLGDGMTIYM